VAEGANLAKSYSCVEPFNSGGNMDQGEHASLSERARWLSDPALNKVIIFHTEDFAAVSKVSDIDLAIVFCPLLYQHIRSQIPNLKIVLPVAATSENPNRRKAASRKAVESSDFLRDSIKDNLSIPFVEHWQRDYYFFYSNYLTRWEEISQNFLSLNPKGKLIVPIISAQAWRYGFHSAIPALSIIEILKGNSSIIIVPLIYGAESSRFINCVPTHIDSKVSSNVPITAFYLPATQYHSSQYQKIIGPNSLMIESPVYSVRYDHKYSMSYARIPNSQFKALIRAMKAIGVDLRRIFTELVNLQLSSTAIGSQVLRYQASIYMQDFLCQYIFYKNLEKNLEKIQVKKLLMTTHTTPFHGPLYSYFVSKKLHVDILPHSSHVDYPFPCAENVRQLAHFSQSYFWDRYSERWCKADQANIIENSASIPNSMASVNNSLRSVLLVLNNQCITHTPFFDVAKYLRLLNSLVEGINLLGLRASIRVKPSASVSKLLSDYSSALGLAIRSEADGPLPDVLRSHDLIILYGWPTAAGVAALQHRRPVIACGAGSNDPMYMLPFDDRLIETLSVEDLLLKLDRWRRLPKDYENYVEAQRYSHSVLLRTFVPFGVSV